MGGENNLVVQCFIVEKWFNGKLLSIAFGLVLVFNLAGTTLNNYITPLTWEYSQNFTVVFLVSFFPLGISAVAAIVYCILDVKYKHLLKCYEADEENFKFSDMKKLSPIFWALFIMQLTTSNVYYQFMNFGTSYTETRFMNSYSVSKNYMAFCPLVIIVLL